jgi:5-methylcytosine-specific restriction endonuclease McrA
MHVFVQNRDKTPLMPTSSARARKLLKAKRATLVRLHPFTIRLAHQVDNPGTQPVAIGVDPGYTTAGVAAVTGDEVVFAAEADVKNDIADRMEGRRSLRRGRRSRKRYRPARFDNRASARRKGKLAPSILARFERHKRLITYTQRILPVTDITIEEATFDTQLMQNPDVNGVEYQRGELHGFTIREYLLQKWQHKCAYCGRSFSDTVRMEVEHVTPKKRGGSNRVSNLVAACETCNKAKGDKTAAEFGHPKVQQQAQRSLKSTAVAQYREALWWWAYERFGKGRTHKTYGSETKFKRRMVLHWDKTHARDAAAIALQLGEVARYPDGTYLLCFRQRRSRSLHKSIPTAMHTRTKAQLRADVLGVKDRDRAIEKGLREGWLRRAPNAPVPTKKEARAFSDAVPGYTIHRTRERDKAGAYLYNREQHRTPEDATRTAPKCRGWNKGDIIEYQGKSGIITGLDKNGAFRILLSNGTRYRRTVNHMRRITRRTAITASLATGNNISEGLQGD